MNAQAPQRKRPTPHPLPSIDGYQLFLDAGTIEEINRRHLKGSVPFWNDMMNHPNRDDFWKKRAILPHLKNVAPAVMVVTAGMMQKICMGPSRPIRLSKTMNPGVNNVLVVGPWIHGGWASLDGDRLGAVPFGSKTAAFYRAEIEFPFFEKYLKDSHHPLRPKPLSSRTGSNTWRTFDAWPPVPRRQKPSTSERTGLLPGNLHTTHDSGFDEYISDPARPVPYTEVITPRMTVEYMVEDQRFAARRPDVLVYQTEPLKEEVVLAGPLQVDLWVSTTGTDADFVVKLIDVQPDGTDPTSLPNFQMMLRSEVIAVASENHSSLPNRLNQGSQPESDWNCLT